MSHYSIIIVTLSTCRAFTV